MSQIIILVSTLCDLNKWSSKQRIYGRKFMVHSPHDFLSQQNVQQPQKFTCMRNKKNWASRNHDKKKSHCDHKMCLVCKIINYAIYHSSFIFKVILFELVANETNTWQCGCMLPMTEMTPQTLSSALCLILVF